MSVLADQHGERGVAWDFGAGRLLAVLLDSATPLTLEQLRDRGIEMPAQAVYTLEIAGYTVDRVAIAGRHGGRVPGYQLRPADHWPEEMRSSRLHWELGARRDAVGEGR